MPLLDLVILLYVDDLVTAGTVYEVESVTTIMIEKHEINTWERFNLYLDVRHCIMRRHETSR